MKKLNRRALAQVTGATHPVICVPLPGPSDNASDNNQAPGCKPQRPRCRPNDGPLCH